MKCPKCNYELTGGTDLPEEDIKYCYNCGHKFNEEPYIPWDGQLKPNKILTSLEPLRLFKDIKPKYYIPLKTEDWTEHDFDVFLDTHKWWFFWYRIKERIRRIFMKKRITINGKPITIKIREPYAPKQQVVKSKKIYSRKRKEKENEHN